MVWEETNLARLLKHFKAHPQVALRVRTLHIRAYDEEQYDQFWWSIPHLSRLFKAVKDVRDLTLSYPQFCCKECSEQQAPLFTDPTTLLNLKQISVLTYPWRFVDSDVAELPQGFALPGLLLHTG